jgi:hypothetical protein
MLDFEAVQVRILAVPRADAGYDKHPSAPTCVRDHRPGRIAEDDGRRARADGVDVVRHPAEPGRPVEAGHDGHVRDMRLRRRAQPHRPVEPRIVEEVVEVPLLLAPVAPDRDHSRRDGRHRQFVVHPDGQPEGLAALHVLRDISLEWRVAPGMIGDLDVACPHGPPVGGCVTSDDDPPARPGSRHLDVTLVPDVTDMLPLRRVGRQVVVASRDRDLTRIVPVPLPPATGTAFGDGIDPETPQAVEPAGLPAAAVSRCQHGRGPPLEPGWGTTPPRLARLAGWISWSRGRRRRRRLSSGPRGVRRRGAWGRPSRT